MRAAGWQAESGLAPGAPSSSRGSPCVVQAIATREQLHTQHARSLQEKDALRKQVRELGERVDELQLRVFQCEGRLRQQRPDAPVLVGLPAPGVGGRAGRKGCLGSMGR